ncbi:non-canonical purine NTP pyrophosphatase [bacterium]|nr:non-canonical purine NTP pyrophosphatase [bacterium]
MIVIASQNEYKIAEIRALPAAEGLVLKEIGAFGEVPEVPEDGTTFEENAVIKAVKYSLWLRRELNIEPPVVAEDAGLMVEGLLGWPGVFSARIAPTTDEQIDLVLERLGDHFNRAAQFVAYTALVINGYLVRTWRGSVTGRLTKERRGTGGFGYDPIFEIPQLGKTFAELDTPLKNELSHRTRSWTLALQYIRERKLAG